MPTLFYALLGVIQLPPTLPAGHTYATITAPNATSLTFSVVVTEDLRELRRIALEVSTPKSPRYGKHLTSAQISALTRPDPSDVAAVRKWLTHPQAYVRENASLFTVTTTVAVAEAVQRQPTNAIGHQPGRPGPVGATPYGFNCTAGWDPVTGLGTPRFGELLKRL